ncbi:MAG: protocatechuate 3,4-dioxygenase subunit alpha [Arcicella sp.]|nr:protocatechuate 3,4-dioxygenase subunit alpha [Arcicella sp.]
MLQTPSQTVGPFFAYSLTAKQYGYNYDSIITDSLVDDSIEGERILITGRIFDGQGNVIPDAVVELNQPDLRFNDLRFNDLQIDDTRDQEIVIQKSKIVNQTLGFARIGTGTSADNSFTFTTVKPKSINGQAPFIGVIIMMRGSLHHLHTRLYFSDENEQNQQDILLNSIPENRRNSLVANKLQKNNQTAYEFNIRMQGENETVFLAV